jgi:hypothetical protein
MPLKPPFTLSDQQKNDFISVLLIEAMVNADKKFSVLLEGDDGLLEQVLTDLYSKKLVDIKKNVYVPTPFAQKKLDVFMKRYNEFLVVYDVFSSVDLTAGEFAYAKFLDMDENQWKVFVSEERWEDLRVTVAAYKDIDPVQIVFMSFIGDERFDLERQGWQFDLVLGTVWNEILEICNSALTVEQIGGDDVILDIIQQGSTLMIDLYKKDKERREEEAAANADETPVVDEVTYYEQYYDPRYVPMDWRGRFW